MPNIVTTNVTQTVAPAPSLLQQTGAFISQGATITTPGTLTLLTQLSDLTPVLKGALALSTLTWSGGIVTATAAAPHGFTVSDTIELTISGVSPAGYNGTYLCTVTTSTAFTYAVTSNPGSETVPGVYTPEDVAELNQMATTFFAQGSSVSVYVLELGAGNPNDGVAFLTSWLTANPGQIYGFLVPRPWDANSNYLALIASYEGTTAKTYFWTTTTLQNYTAYTALMKCVFALVEAPQQHTFTQNALTAATWSNGVATFSTTTAHGVNVGDWFQVAGMSPVAWNVWYQAQPGTAGTTLIGLLTANPGAEIVLGSLIASTAVSSAPPSTEFTLAAPFWNALHYQPSSTNKVAPFAFQYVFGVTPWIQKGNNSILTLLKNAAVNYVTIGSEGGISNTAIFWGTTMDARDFTYWYSVDWMQINADLNIANAVINGSNNPTNPLYYDQNGINRLQDVIVSTVRTAVAVGLANGVPARSSLTGTQFTQAIENDQFEGKIVVNAVPFIPYLTVNPSDYKIGRYQGFSIQYTPNRGFVAITLNINVTDFIVQ